MFSSPLHYINPANQVPEVQTGPEQVIKSFHRLIGKTVKLKKKFS